MPRQPAQQKRRGAPFDLGAPARPVGIGLAAVEAARRLRRPPRPAPSAGEGTGGAAIDGGGRGRHPAESTARAPDGSTPEVAHRRRARRDAVDLGQRAARDLGGRIRTSLPRRGAGMYKNLLVATDGSKLPTRRVAHAIGAGAGGRRQADGVLRRARLSDAGLCRRRRLRAGVAEGIREARRARTREKILDAVSARRRRRRASSARPPTRSPPRRGKRSSPPRRSTSATRS